MVFVCFFLHVWLFILRLLVFVDCFVTIGSLVVSLSDKFNTNESTKHFFNGIKSLPFDKLGFSFSPSRLAVPRPTFSYLAEDTLTHQLLIAQFLTFLAQWSIQWEHRTEVGSLVQTPRLIPSRVSTLWYWSQNLFIPLHWSLSLPLWKH